MGEQETERCSRAGCRKYALWGCKYCGEHLSEEGGQAVKAWRDKVEASTDKLEGACLADAPLEGANLEDAHLEEANLIAACLQRANLREARLQRANLRGAQLQNAFLWDASLQNAKLESAHLQEAKLKRAQLQNADLWEAQLQNADLTQAQMQNAHLRRAQLQDADLTGAQLQDADLSYADLKGAKLNRANLEGANLTFCDLTGVPLAYVSFTRPLRFPPSLLDAVSRFCWLWRRGSLNRLIAVVVYIALPLSLCASPFMLACRTGPEHRGYVYMTLPWSPLVMILFLLGLHRILAPYWDARLVQRILKPTLWLNAVVDSVGRCDARDLRYIKDQSYLEAFLAETKKKWCGRRFLAFLWGLTCGYGSDIWLWIGWSLALALSFGFTYWIGGTGLVTITKSVKPLAPGLWTSIYFSIVTFTTLGFGDVTPVTRAGETVVMMEVVLGYVMLGGLISILATKLARLA